MKQILIVQRTCPSFKTTLGSLSPTLTSGVVDAVDIFKLTRETGETVLVIKAGLVLAVLYCMEAYSNVMERRRMNMA